MLKNICKYLTLSLIIICSGTAASAQKKPSDQKLSADIIKIRQMQAQRNAKAKQVGQSTPSDNGTPGNGNGPGGNLPPKANGKASDHPINLPPKPVINH